MVKKSKDLCVEVNKTSSLNEYEQVRKLNKLLEYSEWSNIWYREYWNDLNESLERIFIL